MRLQVMFLSMAAGFLFAGCDPVMKRVDALDAKLWEETEWISAADAPVADDNVRRSQRAADGTSWFVREFINEGNIKSAVWMTSGLGVYEVYVNGVKVGDDVLKPGFTHLKETKYSFTYDITSGIKTSKGEKNVLAAEVSSGWWRDRIVNYAGIKSAFRAVLRIEYDNGAVQLVGTKAGEWMAGNHGPVTHAGIFDGEEYDARINKPVFGDVSFKPAVKNEEFNGVILPTAGAEICCRYDKILMPKEGYFWSGIEGADEAAKAMGKVRKLRDISKDFMKKGNSCKTETLAPGETLVIDFGQNAAAVPLFVFKAAENTVLTCLPAEMLNDSNGEASRGNDGPGGSVYRQNLRLNNCMILKYIFGKDDGDKDGFVSYMPRFTFFGYRYVSITATDTVEFKAICSVPVTSIFKEQELGSLRTGNEDVNKLISNVYWGQLSNYLSVPTDCPQRNERLGWTADTQVFCEAGTYNADTVKFFHKWTRDLRNSRDKDGGYPSVAPLGQYGAETFNLGWADAGVIVPWTIWKQFGDVKIIEDNYEAMAKFVRKLDETKYKYDDKHYTYADWLSYETFETSGNIFGDWSKWSNHPDARNYREYLAACYWLYDSRLMVDIANALGKSDDAAFFCASGVRALKYIRETYLEDDGMLLKPMRHLQTACIFALKFGVVEGEAVEKTKAVLLNNIKEHGDCLQTGFLGTSFLMDTLTESGLTDVAYTLLLQHKNPSWLYSVDQGATTIWERWNSYTKEKGFGPVGMNSFNHYAYGAVLAWMYKHMAGIAADVANPGFKKILMTPKPDRRIGSVDAQYKSAAGMITSEWHYEGDVWVWNFSVPEGAIAEVTLPGDEKSVEYTAGKYTVRRVFK